MNRANRRKFVKKMARASNMRFKIDFFRAILYSYLEGEESCKKVIDEQGKILGRIKGLFIPDSLSKIAISIPTYNRELRLEDSFNMSIMFCEMFTETLNKYVCLKEEYENYLIKCDFDNADRLLDMIESKCGVSIWGCGQKLIIKENKSGLEGNKDLLAKYLGKAKQNTIVSTLLEFLSYRAESNTSLNNYNEKVDKFIKCFENDISFTYFSYKLKVQDISYTEDFNMVLQVDAQTSIIDLYNSIIDILQRAHIYKYKLSETIINKICSLNTIINDYRVENLLVINGKKESIKIEESVLKIIENYTNEKYDLVIQQLTKYLDNVPNDLQMWIMLMKCHIYTKKKFKCENSLLKDIYNVYSINEHCNVSRNKVMNAIKMYNDTSWKYKLLSISNRKLICHESHENYIQFSLVNEHTITPSFMKWVDYQTIKKKYTEDVKNFVPKTLSLFNEIELVTDEGKIFSNIRERIFYSDYLWKMKEYFTAIEILEDIDITNTECEIYICEKIVRRLYNLYLEVKETEKAIELIVNSFFINENLIKRCDLAKLSKKLKFIRNYEVLENIKYPIFVYLSDKLGTKKHRIALSNFLDFNQICDVDHLITLNFESKKTLTFFYEKICVLNVIKREIRLATNASEAAMVRVRVLQRLIEINPKEKDKYFEEISVITTHREINNRIRQVSQHKIYVDIEKIKEEKKEIYEENFNKYLLIKSFNKEIEGFDVTDITNIESIKNVINSMNEEIKKSIQYSQTILALKELISGITYEFLRNEKYGLDTFLSSRIRHGYCKSQLTKEFRQYHLMLASRDDESLKYDVSQYWDDKIDENQNEDYLLLKEMLSEFTSKMEMKIQEIKKEWIRIKLDKSEFGEFDFSDFDSAMLVVDNNKIVDFDVMYNWIITQLWERTDYCLSRIRKRIQEELKSFYFFQLNELETNIKKLKTSSISKVIEEIESNITKCKARISSIISDFENIFYKDNVIYEDYTVQELETTCIGIEQQIHADFTKICIKKMALGEKRLKGTSFSYLVEVVIMIINNAISHAGFNEMRDISLMIEICLGNEYGNVEEIIDALREYKGFKNNWEANNLLIISVKNNLAIDKNIEIIKKKIQYIFDNAKDPKILNKYSISEGGTGIYKIYKTIKYNVTAPYVIMYDVQPGEFTLTLVVDVKMLYA